MNRTFVVLIAALAAAGVASAAELPVYIDGTLAKQANSAPEDQSAAPGEQSVFYQVAYPKDWQALGLETPMCAPCDHTNDGVTWTDFHDHLMVRPHLEKRHVFNIGPAYTGDAARDGAVVAAYAEHLPVTSAVAANRLLAARMDDGAPVAEISDFGFYFVATLVHH